MRNNVLGCGAWLVLCVGLATVNAARAEDRPAEKILADIKAVEMPKPPANRSDRAAVQEFIVKSQKAAEQRSTLIGELYKSHPGAAELPDLILERWQGASMPGPKVAELKSEIEEVLAKSKDEKLVAHAAFAQALMGFRKLGQNATPEKLLPLAEEFIKRAPKDPRGARLLAAVASKMPEAAKADIMTRIEKDYPDSPVAKQKAAEARLKDAVGKPFKIEFTEAIKGGQVNMASLKGKVLIIDFWATWCGPCVQEMPKMKELYAEFKDKGVEFIGVSLDAPRSEGGYDALKAFVEKNKIEWPQFYQGNGWESDFSMSWGINSIPAVFAVDADGNLFTTEARGKLEKLIPELLEKAEKSAKAKIKP